MNELINRVYLERLIRRQKYEYKSLKITFLPDNLQKVCSCTKIYFKISFFGFVFISIKLSYLPQQHTTSLTHLRHPQKKTQTQNPAMSSINPTAIRTPIPQLLCWLLCWLLYQYV